MSTRISSWSGNYNNRYKFTAITDEVLPEFVTHLHCPESEVLPFDYNDELHIILWSSNVSMSVQSQATPETILGYTVPLHELNSFAPATGTEAYFIKDGDYTVATLIDLTLYIHYDCASKASKQDLDLYRMILTMVRPELVARMSDVAKFARALQATVRNKIRNLNFAIADRNAEIARWQREINTYWLHNEVAIRDRAKLELLLKDTDKLNKQYELVLEIPGVESITTEGTQIKVKTVCLYAQDRELGVFELRISPGRGIVSCHNLTRKVNSVSAPNVDQYNKPKWGNVDLTMVELFAANNIQAIVALTMDWLQHPDLVQYGTTLERWPKKEGVLA